MTYYNEFDPGAAEWLRELIRAGLIPAGDVDERSITDVASADLVRYRSCHFFAGIGGWAYALRLAGWPDDRPVWTGSCPCQPYSSAGKGKGDADARNLWPAMFRLVRECRPSVVFGEQVEGAVRHGWLDGVSADLEGEGYAVGAAVLGAHSVGAPHIRQRLYWVADAGRERGGTGSGPRRGVEAGERCEPGIDTEQDGRSCRLADSTSGRRAEGYPDGSGCRCGACSASDRAGLAADRGPCGVGDATGDRWGQGGLPTANGAHADRQGATTQRGDGGPADHWRAYDLIPCRDGKARRVEPGSFPLAHGIPGRVGLLRGYGNAIVPQVAAAFVRAYLATADATG